MVSIPLVCLPIALALVYLPKVPVAMAAAKAGGYDNVDPRDQQAKLTGSARRAAAAHANGFESFPAFGIGVLVAHVTQANPVWATWLSIAYVIARAIYPFLYIAGLGSARSTIWMVGFAATFGLMLLPLF